MRNLLLLFVFTIALDRLGLLVSVSAMNNTAAYMPQNFNELFEGLAFMLLLGFWYWIALYTGWMIANILLVYFCAHSMTRSIVAGASILLAYWLFGTTWAVAAWHLILGTIFGLLHYKYVNRSPAGA